MYVKQDRGPMIFPHSYNDTISSNRMYFSWMQGVLPAVSFPNPPPEDRSKDGLAVCCHDEKGGQVERIGV